MVGQDREAEARVDAKVQPLELEGLLERGDDTATEVLVSIDPEGQVYLNDEKYTVERLRAELVSLAAVDPKRRLYVRADAGVPYGQVIETLGAVREAGLSRVGLVTEPPGRQ